MIFQDNVSLGEILPTKKRKFYRREAEDIFEG